MHQTKKGKKEILFWGRLKIEDAGVVGGSQIDDAVPSRSTGKL
jgi:hypothetical protein